MGGKDRVDHPPGQHDDHANALALAAAKARQGGVRPFVHVADGVARIGERRGGYATGQAPLASRGVGGGQSDWVKGWYS